MTSKNKTHINIDKNGNAVIQDEKREAVAVVVDGKAYVIRRAKGDKI